MKAQSNLKIGIAQYFLCLPIKKTGMKFFIVLCFLLFSKEGHSQWLDIEDSLELYIYSDSLDLSSENSFYFSKYGGVYSCDLLFKNTDSNTYKVEYYKRRDFENHLFFHLWRPDGRKVYGWFKKVLQEFDGETVYCWVEDLLWIYINKDNSLDKIVFFSDGVELRKIPKSIGGQ